MPPACASRAASAGVGEDEPLIQTPSNGGVERPSGTVTFLFTDIEASTQLWESHPREMTVALARHDEIIHSAVAVHGGFVFFTGGDGFGAAFLRSVDAVEAAIESQRRLRSESWPGDVSLLVRMGVHTGEAHERDGNYFGPPLNRAARVMAAAHGGQIVITSATVELLGQVSDVGLVDLGPHRLRGVAERVALFGIIAPDLPWVDRPLATVDHGRGNLPLPATDFVGSVRWLNERVEELRHRRLVTFTGTGGVGKTRLATECAWSLTDELADGAWLVELASVSDSSAVAAIVASSLSIQPQPGMPLVASIVEWLRGRRILLVIDNCEHVIIPVAELIRAVLARCPTVTILATSRESLGVPGERVHLIQSLDPSSDAVELFTTCANAADGMFRPTATDLESIGAICRRLDGNPLAIELAAARIRSLSPSDLLRHLDDRFRLLRATRDATGRHRTLRATVEWSYQLMTEQERLLFNRTSVFAGSFDSSAAVAVCSDITIVDELDVVEVLGLLIDKSMLTADRSPGGLRFRLLETLRLYAAERLEMRDETSELRGRHLAHYLDVARSARVLWTGPRQREAGELLEREWGNVRAAHDWAISERNLEAAEQLVGATGPYARAHLNHEHREWVVRTIALEGAGSQPGTKTYGWASEAAVTVGELETAARLAQRGIDVAPSPDHPDTAACWTILAQVAAAEHRTTESRQAAQNASRAAEAHPDPLTRGGALAARTEAAFQTELSEVPQRVRDLTLFANTVGAPSLLSWAAYHQGRQKMWVDDPPDPSGALDCYRRGLNLAQESANARMEGFHLIAIVFAATELRTPDARDACVQVITRLYDARWWGALWLALAPVATWLSGTDEIAVAAVIYGYLDAHRPLFSDIDGRVSALAVLRSDPALEQPIAKGAAMNRDELVGFVLARLRPDATATVAP